ncbi:MAG: cell division protein SepF [Ruminococcaceae bacterium]|nr:cell division protein SepF [Oscillospiraceae bacterium]
MGIWDKVKGMVNPPEEDDYYDDDEGYYDFEDEPAVQQPAQQTASYAQPVQSRQSSMGVVGGALEMKVVKPEKYDSATAQKIADHLLNNRTVVLNLEVTNKESARRLIDFLSGVAYSIDGYIQRVANNTFVIVPKNVDVSGEQLQEARKQDDTDLY